MENALEAVDVFKSYGEVVALEGVSLSIGDGECIALVGETGSGKSTLLHCFNRVIEPDQGEIRVRGNAARSYDQYQLRRNIGFVPQNGGLLPHWNVLRNTALVPRLVGQDDAEERARKALNLVGLEPGQFELRWPHELSGGQRQRVAFARAISADPDIVLLDEPFGAIDAITRSELRATFMDLSATLNFASLFITHDLREALEVAQRIMVLRRGQVQQLGSPAEITGSPANEYVERLVRLSAVSLN